jgi:hypothetical protein
MKSIRDLPEDTICDIATKVIKDDLPSFRLVSRTLRRCAQDSFVRTFFEQRTHLDTDQSLRNLVNITRDQKLRRLLKPLSILTIDTEYRQGIRRRLDHIDGIYHSSDGNGSDGNGSDDDTGYERDREEDRGDEMFSQNLLLIYEDSFTEKLDLLVGGTP